MKPLIPKHFHFVFGLRPQTEAFHVVHYLCLESCRQVNQPERMTLYYHHLPFGPYWDRIRPSLELVHVELNQTVSKFHYKDSALRPLQYAHQSDFIRLEKVLEHGGVYADIDTLFVNPIPDQLFEKSFVMGKELELWDPKTEAMVKSLCNAFLMAEPGALFGQRWRDAMAGAFDGTWSNHSTLLPQRLAEVYPEEVHIEPEASFYSFPPTSKALFALFEDCLPMPRSDGKKAFSIHLWEHLWWDRKRTDYSMFHHGLLTEHAIRTEASAYNCWARCFLPELPICDGLNADPLREALRSQWDKAVADARALAGLLLLPFLNQIRPGTGRLDLARAYWAYRKASSRFAIRNAMERSILRWVIQWDEYGMFREPLRAADVVIDVGAHIGCFSFACREAGSRNIHAFEPYPGNYERLRKNVGSLSGIQISELAVFRSDLVVEGLEHSGPSGSNTGAGSVLYGGGNFDNESREFHSPDPEAVVTARTIALDEILGRFKRVKVLKLDCEGSEFPILLTSKLLSRVERIVGEFHEVSTDKMQLVAPEARVPAVDEYTMTALAECLRGSGFQVKAKLTTRGIGLFEAVR